MNLSYTIYPSGCLNINSLSINILKEVFTLLTAFKSYFLMKAAALTSRTIPSLAIAFNSWI